jgi:uncharacterized tellurite resistance protein B-like protein
MGWGKILGMAAVGVAAVAAAPFTGGGSILGAATLAGSLGTAGAVAGAVGAGAAGAYAGKKLSDMDEDEKARSHQKVKKFEAVVKEHEKHTNLILALSALGCAMANADGEISPEEIVELNEFVGGLSSTSYPTHIAKQIKDMISNPPTFNEAMEHLTKVDSIEFPELRNFLVMIMESDGVVHKKEEAFLKAFDIKIAQMTK